MPTNPYSPANQVAGVHQAYALASDNSVLGAALVQQQAQIAAGKAEDLPDAGPLAAVGLLAMFAFGFFIFLFRNSATAVA